MAYAHITAGSAANISQGRSRKVIIQVNAALTGTITVSDETGTTGSPVIGIITNPTVGTQYEYWDIKNGVTVTPSTTCEVTCSISSGMGGNQ
jgi:hypothetical protein